MTGTTTGIWIMCIVIVAGLVIWLGAVALAARRSGRKNEHVRPMRGLVQGGEHIGGGRSVMPTRDAEVPEGGGEALAPEDMMQSGEERPRHKSGSPIDR
jgi:hypothetical protein